ncbi:glycosyltransferase [Vibrio fluvialis]|nr:glycosyltransferase [Vibrio fluvialis]
MKNKFIFINSLTSGGAEKVVTTLLNNNSDLKVITIWPDNFYNINKSEVITLLKKRGFLVIDLITALIMFIKLLKRENISSINSHLFWANYINAVSKVFCKHRVIATHCVSFVSKFESNKMAYAFHKVMLKILSRYIDVNTYKSLAMKDEYERIFNLRNGIVIYNPIDIKYIQQRAKEEINFEFKCDKKYALCVGRFHKTKNQISLLKILTRLTKDIEIIFLGDGPELQTCINVATDLNILDRVHFIGNVINPYPFFLSSDYYISISKSEGFPNALIEAIVLGLYPIHSDCHCGPREIISKFTVHNPILTDSSNKYEVYDLGILTSLNEDSILNAINYCHLYNPVIHNDEIVGLAEKLTPCSISNKYIELL